MVGSGVDDSVRRIAKTYEVRGMSEHVTSYDNPDGRLSWSKDDRG